MYGNITLFAPLQKIENSDDGDDDTVTVTGYASSEVVDSDGEIVTASAIRDALPDYFRDGTGALREMHQMVAAGVVVSAEIDDKNRTAILATVVDSGTIRKLRAGVLKGFSIGGKTIARDPKNKKVITKIRLDEISLVDRPSNSAAVLTVFKASGGMHSDPGEIAMSRIDRALASLADVDARITKLEASRGAAR